MNVDNTTGELMVSGKGNERIRVSAKDVFLWREEDDSHAKIAGTWDAVENVLKSIIDRRVAASERAGKFRQLFKGILKGLDEKILHNDTTQLPPITAVMDGASLERRRGRVVYALRERGVALWKKDHNEPYPPGTSLKIEGLELSSDVTIVYEGYDPANKHLIISFPMQLDVSGLQGRELEIRSAEMRPPELRQKEYLQRWLDDFDSQIMQAMINGCDDRPINNLKLFNSAIAKYEMQQEAVAYGVSDVPLFLLKGPPGTGKTTIIVEIIRQSIHKGQRVLLTSQTHQAVENVLEKLHGIIERGEDGFIRMVHYTVQEGKASDLARRYGEGAGTEEIKEIREYVTGCIEKNDRMLSSVYSPKSMNALRKLCDEGIECIARIEKARKAQKVDFDKLDQDLAASMAKIESEKTSRLAELDGSVGDDIRQNRERLAKSEAALERSEVSVSKCAAAVATKQNRLKTLSEDSIASKIKRSLSILSKNFDVDAVRGQLASAREKHRKAMQKRGTLSEEVSCIQKTIVERQAVYDQGKKTVESAALDRRSECSASFRKRRSEMQLKHSQAIAGACGSYAQQIEKITSFLGYNAGLTEQSIASDWHQVYDRVEEEGVRLRQKQSFMSEWEKTLTEKPEVVARFLDSQTNVFMATCVGVGGWRRLMDGTYDRRFDGVEGVNPDRFFDLVVVDEAGHATIAETLIPLSMGSRAILIGDDKQLPPMDDDELNTESLFSKLWEDCDCKVPRVMLDTQFRMHPDIANFVSATFYNGKLKNGVAEADRSFQFSSFNRPVCLLSTSNQPKHYETRRNTSYQNELEAVYVKEILDALILHCNEHGAKGESVSVAVITPYAEQVSLIRQKVRPLIGVSGNVLFSEEDIASVDKFQGGERDIVIASFVRSPEPGKKRSRLTFVQDLKRMNVAFSRPRKMLILVGDIKALSTELGDEDGRKAFEAFHGEVQRNGLEVLAWERKVG